MTSTVFVNGVTLTDDDWFNDVNRLHYTIFADPADVATARRTLLAGMDKITNSLGADVSLNNTANFFDGPSVAQGTTGTWFVSGTITLVDTAGVAAFNAKLWDGTTVIASARSQSSAAGGPIAVSLSGYITNPAANIRISARDITSTSGKIVFNDTGNSADSTISAVRIG